MGRVTGLEVAGAPTLTREARVCVLISTHALPPLSYRIPDDLREKVAPGAAVVVPLSGHARLGVVVQVRGEDKAREPVYGVVDGLGLPPGLVEVCRRVSGAAAMPLSTVLCAALPPGMKANRYRVMSPAPGWPWAAESQVIRSALRRHLGSDGLRAAESTGRVRLDPGVTEPRLVEWAVIRSGARPDLARAPRQRELFGRLSDLGGRCLTSELLATPVSPRAALRELVKRGAVRLERRPEPPPVFSTRGGEAVGDPGGYARDAGRVVDRGGAWLWRLPSSEQPAAAAAVVGAAIEGGEQALVLVPEIKAAERIVDYLCDTLPDGYTIAAYHSALDRGRGAVYRMARDGEVDVVVGTRPAALLPLRRLGAICVLDEPNEAHRAQPGYEGLQMHVRDVVLEREEVEGPGVVLISAYPSLRLYARRDRVRELAARPPDRWPIGRIVDLRGSGAVLSEELISVCRQHLREGKRIALISNRLGYSTSVVCNHCGSVQVCPNCDLPLALREGAGPAFCSRCGYRAQTANRCAACGSGRMSQTGLGVERLRHEVSRALDASVGLLTAGQRELEDAPVVVGTARCVTDEMWPAVAVADADALLLAGGMGSAERAFRTLYRAAEAAEEFVVVQTRTPDHYVLRAALRGDYPAFADAELPRLRTLGYPPFAHLAALTLWGGEEPVRRAVELHLRPSLKSGVSMSEPVAVPQTGGEPVWRVLLRSPDRDAVARAGLAAARMVVRQRGKNKVKAQVEIDPEEV